MARYDDLNTSAIGYATFISTILFVIIVLLLRALSFYWMEGEADRKLADVHYSGADAEISEQRSRVDGYGREMVTVFKGEGDSAVEEEVEQLHIPVDVAKGIILKAFASSEADHRETSPEAAEHEAHAEADHSKSTTDDLTTDSDKPDDVKAEDKTTDPKATTTSDDKDA